MRRHLPIASTAFLLVISGTALRSTQAAPQGPPPARRQPHRVPARRKPPVHPRLPVHPARRPGVAAARR